MLDTQALQQRFCVGVVVVPPPMHVGASQDAWFQMSPVQFGLPRPSGLVHVCVVFASATRAGHSLTLEDFELIKVRPILHIKT